MRIRRPALVAALLLVACGGGGGASTDGTDPSSATTTTEPAPVELTEGASAPASGADGGTTLETTATLSADGLLSVELTVADDLGVHEFTEIRWGDDVVDGGLATDCDEPGDIPDPVPTDTTDVVSFTHAYRTPGRYDLRIRAGTAGPSCNEYEVALASYRVIVTTGHGGTNGPAAPAGTFVLREGTGGDVLSLLISTSDPDGWVREVVIDWHDGSELQVVPTTSGCDDPAHAYPRTEPYSRNIPDQLHPGAFPPAETPTVLVRSSGCDGSDVQEAEAVVEPDPTILGG